MGSRLIDVITSQTAKALWEVKNVIDCVPEELWDKCYCEMPILMTQVCGREYLACVVKFL